MDKNLDPETKSILELLLILLVVMFVLFSGLFTLGAGSKEEMDKKAIEFCIEQDYRLLIDGLFVDIANIKDVETFNKNYHILYIDQETKILAVEHDDKNK